MRSARHNLSSTYVSRLKSELMGTCEVAGNVITTDQLRNVTRLPHLAITILSLLQAQGSAMNP